MPKAGMLVTNFLNQFKNIFRKLNEFLAEVNFIKEYCLSVDELKSFEPV